MAIRGELKPHRLYLLRHADAVRGKHPEVTANAAAASFA